MSSDRGTTNGAPSGNDMYAAHGEMQNGYATGPPVMNGGSTAGIKRGRDDDDDQRPSSVGPTGVGLDLKRRKTIMEGSMPSPIYSSQPAATEIGGQRRR